MRFSVIRLLEQTEQNFRRFESVSKKRVAIKVGLFYMKKRRLKLKSGNNETDSG